MKLCVECGKNQIRAKGKCNSCLFKAYRKTDKGRAATKRYNQSQNAKNAQKRYRDKKGLPTRKIRVKTECFCGKMSVAKGFCNTCYSRKYYKLNYKPNNTDRKNKINIELLFKNVLEKVKTGQTIQNACKSLRTSTSTLYRNIDEKQKLELIAYKKKILIDFNEYEDEE